MSERPDRLRDRSADVLPDTLAMAGARTALTSTFRGGGDWSLRFGGSTRPKVIAVEQGTCWVRSGSHEPVLLRAGDAYLLAGGAYVTASDPALRPTNGASARTTTNHSGYALTDGHEDRFEAASGYGAGRYEAAAVSGAGRYEAGSGAVTVRMSGSAFDFDDVDAARLLLGGLPPARRLGPGIAATVSSLAAQATGAGRAGDAVRWHLTQALYLQVFRAALNDSAGLLGALRDPGIGAALIALHDHPAERWTVARLAATAGLSRTVFATRFTDLVGVPPMTYLLRRRIAGATRDLAAGRTVAATARRWGYASESAFSAAYRRETGYPPAAYGRETRHSPAVYGRESGYSPATYGRETGYAPAAYGRETGISPATYG